MILDNSKEIDDFRFMNELERLGFVYVRKDLALKYSEELDEETKNLSRLCSYVMKIKSGGECISISDSIVYKYLTSWENVPKYRLSSKDNGSGVSIAKKNLDPLFKEGYAHEFLGLYLDYKTAKSKRGTLSNVASLVSPTDEVDTDGNPLYKLKFDVTTAVNRRYYYKNYSILNIPKNCLDVIAARKGRFLVSGDIEQADLCVAYNMLLKTPDSLRIMRNFRDKYEGIYKLVTGDKYDHDEFMNNRTLYKTNTLAPLYGQSSNVDPEAQSYSELINKYTDKNETYKTFKNRIEFKQKHNMPLRVTSYWHHTREIYEDLGRSAKTQALNAPVQTGTSEIIMQLVYYILDRFAEYGVTPENGGILFYFNRHDEPIFDIAEEHIDKCFIFGEARTIFIKGWLPINIDFIPMKAYGVVYDRLEKRFKDEMDKGDPGDMKLDPDDMDIFIPTSKPIDLHVRKVNCDGIDYFMILDDMGNYEIKEMRTPGVTLEEFMKSYTLSKKNFDCFIVHADMCIKTYETYTPKFIKFTPNTVVQSVYNLNELEKYLFNQLSGDKTMPRPNFKLKDIEKVID